MFRGKKRDREKKKINIGIFAKGHSLMDQPMPNTSESKGVCVVCVFVAVLQGHKKKKTHESFF